MNRFQRRPIATSDRLCGVLVHLGAAWLMAVGAPADETSATPSQTAESSPIDALDQAALQETFRLLRTNYIEREALTLEELNRAALDGLLARLDFGAELVPITAKNPQNTAATPTPSDDAAAIAEPLESGVAYLRPTQFSLESLPLIDAALSALGQSADTTLILDLRTPGPPAEFAVAAQILDRFVPDGQPLFTVRKTDDPTPREFRSSGISKWPGKVIALIDDDCPNAAETIAAVLRQALQAPLIGSATRGRTMQYETAPISATHALRFASAEMRLPDDTSLFRKGLAPDLEIPAASDVKSAVFARQSKEGAKLFITNPERPRHNEAALVAKTAPELAFQIAKSAGVETQYDAPPPQDRPLQAALDVLTARRALK
ncbi:MAG: S41 family peptidase [Verrucomicrobiales bacterium]